MDWGSVGEVAVATIGALAAGLKLMDTRQATSRRRRRLMRDLDLLERLPADSDARQRLEAMIHQAVLDLVSDETEKRRDWTGIVLATAFLLGAGWAGFQYWAHNGSGWWLVLLVVLGVFGLVGVAQDAVPRRRDAGGRPIREDRPQGDRGLAGTD
jgi:hypothetical protein